MKPPRRVPDPPPGVGGAPGWLLDVVVDRRVAFLLVGGINTAVGGLWFVVLDTFLGPLWAPAGHYAALGLTYVAAILCAFVLYRTLVFRVHGSWWLDLARFSTVYVGAFATNLALFGVLFQILGLHPFLAQFVNIVVVAILSYVLHGRFSFRRSRPGGGA